MLHPNLDTGSVRWVHAIASVVCPQVRRDRNDATLTETTTAAD